ncbi:hypothetical protein ACWJJH_15700 [Endozoicomonadaceae bacterium StTr2]
MACFTLLLSFFNGFSCVNAGLSNQMVLRPPGLCWDSHFLDTGFPSCLRAPPSDAEEGRLNLYDIPDNWYSSEVIKQACEKAALSEYSPLLPVSMRLEDISELGLDSRQTFAAVKLPQEIDSWPTVFLIRVDDAESSETCAITVRQTEINEPYDYRCRGVISAVPDSGLIEPGANYAFVVMKRATGSKEEETVDRSWLQQLLSPTQPTKWSYPAHYRQGYQCFRSWLKAHECPPERILGAVCWKTGHPEQFLVDFIKHIDSNDGLTAEELTLVYSEHDSGRDYDVYKGEMKCPLLQRLSRPASFLFSRSGYEIEEEEQKYKSYGTRRVPVTITIPKSRNCSGEPVDLVQLHHGTGGGADEPYVRGRKTPNGKSNQNTLALNLIPEGWAVICAGTFMGREHEYQKEVSYSESWMMAGLTWSMQHCTDFSLELNHTFYRYAHLPSMVSNLLQSLLERRVLDNLIINKKVRVSGGGRDDLLQIGRHVLAGHSFGGMTVASFVGQDASRYQGAIYSGAGNFGIGLPVNFLAPIYGLNDWAGTWNFGIKPSELLQDLTHPVWMLAELYLSRVSPVLMLTRNRLDMPMLFISGIDDNQVPDFMQRPFLQACGVNIDNPDETAGDLKDQLLSGEDPAGWVGQELARKKKVLVRFKQDRFSRGRPVNSHNALFQYDVAGQLCAGFVRYVSGLSAGS